MIGVTEFVLDDYIPFVLDDYIPVLSSRQRDIFHEFLDVYRNEPHDEFDII